MLLICLFVRVGTMHVPTLILLKEVGLWQDGYLICLRL